MQKCLGAEIFALFLAQHFRWSKRFPTIGRKPNQRMIVDAARRPFNKNTLYGLLTNVAYIGKVRYKDEIHEGEHEAIVETELFTGVKRQLHLNHRTGGARVRNQFGALLKGMLHCVPCGCSMIHSHTTKDGNKRYRYYVCMNAQKRGWNNCPSRWIPAAEIERFVVDQIRSIALEPALLSATFDQIRQQVQSQLDEFHTERAGIEKDLARANTEMRDIVTAPSDSQSSLRQADLLERIQIDEQRLTEIQEETYRLRGELVTEQEVKDALQEFDPVWESLSPREQARVLALLVERVEYNGAAGTVAVNFRPWDSNRWQRNLNARKVRHERYQD